jgi:hypothetical protein
MGSDDGFGDGEALYPIVARRSARSACQKPIEESFEVIDGNSRAGVN